MGALKFYPTVGDDQRDRLRTEFAALNFMTTNGIIQVPTPIAAEIRASTGVAWPSDELVGACVDRGPGPGGP